jgi:hypothetical protein
VTLTFERIRRSRNDLARPTRLSLPGTRPAASCTASSVLPIRQPDSLPAAEQGGIHVDWLSAGQRAGRCVVHVPALVATVSSYHAPRGLDLKDLLVSAEIELVR